MAAARDYGARPRRGRWRLYVFLALLLAAGLAFLLRSLVLAGVVLPLIAGGPEEEADRLLIVGGDARFETAARLLGEGKAKGILVLEQAAPRTVQAGILPDAVSLARRELRRHGARGVNLVVLDADSEPFSPEGSAARALDRWLQANPGQRVAVLCPAFASRRLRRVYSRVLGERSDRLLWHPLHDRRYDSKSWWQTDAGMTTVAASYAALLQSFLVPGHPPTGEEHDPVAWLAAQPGGRPPDPVPAESPAP